jgi:hypothetical protein
MSTTSGNLSIYPNGAILGGSAAWSYDSVAALIRVTGTAQIDIEGVNTTQPFSGSHALPAADFLSANCIVGQTFQLDSYTFYCTQIDTVNKTATYMVSGKQYFGNFVVSTAATLPTFVSGVFTYNYGGAYGVLCFKAV